jgi:SAM-dependent methyltransferase
MFVNLACGPVYVESDSWLNLDFSPAGPGVRQADLLGRLPVADGAADAVYCSHFLEHVPLASVPAFLSECRRILRSGGTLRLVLPDLEEMCREYLTLRDSGEHSKADFLVLEMVDQCVRREPGGRLGSYYRELLSRPDREPMMDFVRRRNGETFSVPAAASSGSRSAIAARLQWLYVRVLIALLPRAFREQNVTLAATGERHTWIWDFHQLATQLRLAGFAQVERKRFDSTGIAGLPLDVLDIGAGAQPRKGAESMYVEAIK